MNNDKRRLGLWIGVVFACVLALAADELGVTEPVMLGLFFVAWVVAVVYTLVYLARPWGSTGQGRALMVKSWGNVILLSLGLATLTFGRDYWGRDFFRVLGMVAFTAGLCYLFATLITSPGSEQYPPRSWLRRKVRR